MYGIFTYIYQNSKPNVGKYTVPYIYDQWYAICLHQEISNYTFCVLKPIQKLHDITTIPLRAMGRKKTTVTKQLEGYKNSLNLNSKMFIASL